MVALAAVVGSGIITGAADAAPVNSYIVVLDPSIAAVAPRADDVAADAGAQVTGLYEHALDGFVVSATPAEAQAMEADPRVSFVEPDRTVHLEAVNAPTGVRRIGATSNGLLSLDGVDDVRVDVDVAIIDTGIDLQHPDLVVAGSVNCLVSGPRSGCAAGGDDDNFHGTHVAGIVGALDNGAGVVGVAPGARLWAVKVLDSTGTGLLSGILRGIDWVTANAGTIEVANMSLTAPGIDLAVKAAIQSAVNAGVAFSVAAGNQRLDAGTISPAGYDNVLAVSALADFDGLPGGLGTPTCAVDVDDTLAEFSNRGAAVDVAAPGLCIRSTIPLERGTDTSFDPQTSAAGGATGVLSGTSMAAPHVAGALALLARGHNPANAADVTAMYDTIRATGSTDWTDDSGDGVQEPLLDLRSMVHYQAVALPACPVTPSGLLAWWKADATTAATIGPSLTGTTAFTPSTLGGSAFRLDGRHALTATAAVTPTTGLTVDGWFRLDAGGEGGTLVSKWDHLGPDGGAGSRSFLLGMNPSVQTVSFMTDETTTRVGNELQVLAPKLFDHAVHHLAATWDQATMSIFVDGSLVASMPSQGGTLNPATTVPLLLGGSSGRGDPLQFRGDLDDVSVWSRALSPLEVAERFLAGTAAMCP
ncbi:MAG: S8 family serine peptidase [Ilumatobacteraceae bacterium]